MASIYQELLPLGYFLTSARVMFPSLPLAATIVAFLTVPHSFTLLARVVYSFVLGSFHTKCVGEETFNEIKKEIDRKHILNTAHEDR